MIIAKASLSGDCCREKENKKCGSTFLEEEGTYFEFLCIGSLIEQSINGLFFNCLVYTASF